MCVGAVITQDVDTIDIRFEKVKSEKKKAALSRAAFAFIACR